MYIYISSLFFSIDIHCKISRKTKQTNATADCCEWMGRIPVYFDVASHLSIAFMCRMIYIYIYMYAVLIFSPCVCEWKFFFCFFPFSFHHLHLFVPHTNVMLSNECHYHPPCERSEGILTRITNTYVHKRGSYFFSLIQQKGRNPRKKKSRESIYIFFFVKGK